METSSHCTVSEARSRLSRLWLLPLTLGVLLVHGYHPLAEDGGLYVAGIEYKLNPTLFPHGTIFVTEHLRFSVFAPVMAAIVRSTHLSLATVLFCIYLLSAALTLLAGLRLAERCFDSRLQCWTATALLGAWWTLPVAGTSLLLMDPYVTGRSLSTPFSLFALDAALQSWGWMQGGDHRGRWQILLLHPAIQCGVWLVLAALFHPLMAVYALGYILLVRMVWQRSRASWWTAVVLGAFLLAAVVQALARPESAAVVAASFSRYYWFLSQWQWFEWAGLVGPLAVFAAMLRWGGLGINRAGTALCRAAVALGVLSAGIALVFAQEHYRSHAVARLQPLRSFLLLYAVMAILLGGILANSVEHLILRWQGRFSRGLTLGAPAVFVGVMALAMFDAQRASFPASIHLELPGRENPNPWVQAFLWTRAHTPPDAEFALDARYVNTEGEDAQTFRAIAERSAIPDFSKDGGEAAITPSLAPAWQRAATATAGLSRLSDAQRDVRLRPFGVQWVILHADAPTSDACPYRNAVVKVCRLPAL